MKKTEKTVIKSNLVYGGADSDHNYKITGSSEKGIVLNRKNMSVRSKDGNDLASTDMGGDKIQYIYSFTNYDCICSLSLKDSLVEIWCWNQDNLHTHKVYFTINGQVMVATDKLPFDIDHQIQYDINESCNGGEFYITDFNENTMLPPLIFSLEDIVTNYNNGTTKYFDDFNILLYQVTLNIAPHHPVFVNLYNSGSGGGLPVGKYNYAIRYADSSGNRTSWSVQTPNIPIPKHSTNNSPIQYPALKNYGDAPDPSTPTQYGIQIQFRVQNMAGYEFIEIRRCSHIDGLSINAFSAIEYKKLVTDINGVTVDITTNPTDVQIIDWVDDANSTDWLPLTDEEDTTDISGAFIAKTLRYYQDRLVPMNIKYASKDVIDNIFIEKNGVLGFPVIEKITNSADYNGHGSVYNNVYYPHLQSGERYGWGIYFQDAYGARSFVKPFDNGVVDLRNYEMPNRRKPLSPLTQYHSVTNWKGACVASNIYQQTTFTHEVFDLANAVAKTDYCAWRNILTNDNLGVANPHKRTGVLSDHGCVIDKPTSGGFVNSGSIGFAPHTPTSPTDTDVSGYNYAVNDYVCDYFTTNPTLSNATRIVTDLNVYGYEPQGFRPNYFSSGMAFWGITNIPSWAKSFSIVRTKPAGRVVCQGIGFWSIKINVDENGFNYASADKQLNKLWFYSPDADNNLLGGGTTWDELVANSTNYSIQLVSPLGAFSEIYDGEYRTSDNTNYPEGVGEDYIEHVGKATGVDMVTYCRVIRENGGGSGEINPSAIDTTVGENNDGYVSYGRWLNGESTGEGKSAIWNTQNGDYKFSVKGMSLKTSGRVNYIEIETNDDIYYHSGIAHLNKIAYPPKQFGEPFYIVNIILDGKDVPYGNNQTSYVETGHLQKIDSIIGYGTNQSINTSIYKLVDERWEDCLVNDLSTTRNTDNRYITVAGNKWLNVTYKTSIELDAIMNELQSNGVRLHPDIDINGNATTTRVYGVYKNHNSPSQTTDLGIKFEWFNQQYDERFFRPQEGDEIIIKYDNRVPIRVFAGDTYIGEDTCCFWDGEINNGADEQNNSWLKMCSGIPYQSYHVNNRDYLVSDTRNTNKIQDINYISPKALRQIMVNFICESKINIPFIYGIDDGENGLSFCYPQIHYVKRPHRWHNHNNSTPIDFMDYNNIQHDYYDRYGFEWNSWNYGGFHILWQANQDYAKILNDRINFSKPLLGFKEITKFCTRIIWSQARKINVQDDPNLKSFPSLNKFDISDAYEEIKYAYDNDSEKGNNLYAITGKGICLLLTDKQILSDKTSNQIAMLAPESGFIQGEYWLTKDIGCPDELWRGIAEYNNDIFIPNRRGVYMIDGLQIKDITVNYGYDLLPYLTNIKNGYLTKMYGIYHQKYNEYWLGIDSLKFADPSGLDKFITIPAKTFVYCNEADKNFWAGYSDYFYDNASYVTKLASTIVNNVYGSKKSQTFVTGQENGLIGGMSYNRLVSLAITPQISQTVEFVDATVNSNKSPTMVRYYDNPRSAFVGETPEAVIRNYTNSYYMQVPRRNDNGNRLQGDSFAVDIIYSGNGKFELVNIESGFKIIKW